MNDQLPFCGPGVNPPCQPDWWMALLFLGLIAAYTWVLWPKRK